MPTDAQSGPPAVRKRGKAPSLTEKDIVDTMSSSRRRPRRLCDALGVSTFRSVVLDGKASA